MPYRVLVSGFSGPIGAALQPALEADGATLVRLVRRPSASANEIQWAPGQPLDPTLVSGFDAVIHLAGESVAARWTDAKKRAILDSRVQGTTTLAMALAQAERKPGVFLSASAVGIYGCRGDQTVTEATPTDAAHAPGFLPDVARAWEAAAEPAEAAGIRVVHPRIGIVLSPKGGALGQMLPIFRLGLGGPLGNGKQWMSWISSADVAGAIRHLLHNEAASGPYNLTAPNPATNASFTCALATILRRPALFAVPAFALRLVFGEMADEALLCSTKALPERLLASGYQFRQPQLTAALAANLNH